MGAPVIGITANLFVAEDRPQYPNKELLVCDRAMERAVARAGGLPILLPVVTDPGRIGAYLGIIDGLLLSGGSDVDPTSYGHEVGSWPGQPERDRFERDLIDGARAAATPILGVCRGLQMLNVACGGTLLTDIETERPGGHAHRDRARYDRHRHPITIEPGTWLDELYGGEACGEVNSVHHQAIDRLGAGLRPVAWSDDGLVEAIVAPADRWTWAVQWHPEWDTGGAAEALFARLVQEAT